MIGSGAAATAAARLPRIIYASRTHSQLQQVARELRRTVYRPKVCVLGSREQLCVHEEVSQARGQAQGAACQALVAAQSCRWHRRLQDLKRRSGGVSVPHPHEGTPEGSRPIPDIEDFAKAAKADDLCPFFYAREIQKSADVLFLPYNYLIDAKTRKARVKYIGRRLPNRAAEDYENDVRRRASELRTELAERGLRRFGRVRLRGLRDADADARRGVRETVR